MESNDTLKKYYNKKKKRRQRRKYAFYSMLTVFFVLLITVLSLTVFFNINDIAVNGNSHYSKETIIKVSGLEKGQNLFRMNKFKIIDGMCEQLPYLASVTIDRHLPVGIEIIVQESKPYLACDISGSFYILDENLKILEKTDAAPDNLPLVTGIVTDKAAVGSVLTDDKGICDRLYALTVALKEHIGDNCVTAIDVSTSYEIKFEYMGRIEVLVGTADNVDHKLELVKYVIDDNRSNETAEIDVSSGERAYYRSVVKTEQEDEAENTEENGEQEDTQQGENSEDSSDKDSESTEDEQEKEEQDKEN